MNAHIRLEVTDVYTTAVTTSNQTVSEYRLPLALVVSSTTSNSRFQNQDGELDGH